MVFSRGERTAQLLPDDEAYALAYETLPDWRRRKCDAYRFPVDRRRSAAAWILLRQMLVERGLDADSLPVSESEFGKPAFDPALGVRFSISHAGDWVMAAISDAEVGCDVERVVPIDDCMLKTCLVDDERTCLAALSGTARDRAFMRLWVRKESYVKAVGRGLGVDLLTFSALDLPPTSDWVWRDFDLDDGHLGCVCASRRAFESLQPRQSFVASLGMI